MPSHPGAKPKPKSSIVQKTGRGSGNGSGPPSYEMLEAQKQVIEAALQFGIPVERLLEAFGINSISTFYQIIDRDSELYRRIETSRAKANYNVAKTLYEKAVNDRDTAACIWWEKTRSRMRERDLTMGEVKDWILNLPYNMRAKLFGDLGVPVESLHGTGLVIDTVAGGHQLPTIAVNFIDSPHQPEMLPPIPGKDEGEK